MDNSWIQETMKIIDDWQMELANLESNFEKIRYDIEELKQRIAVAEDMIREYRNKHNITSFNLEDIYPGCFGNKTYPEMLIEIAKRNGGYLKVTDAVEIMLQADVSKNKRFIQANVYPALKRMRNRFIKVRRGEYRLTNGIIKQTGKSGLREVVKKLKEKNPQMTKTEVLKYLMKMGFDFKGRRPANALNITWAYLGYSKEGKQQSLDVRY